MRSEVRMSDVYQRQQGDPFHLPCPFPIRNGESFPLSASLGDVDADVFRSRVIMMRGLQKH